MLTLISGVMVCVVHFIFLSFLFQAAFRPSAVGPQVTNALAYAGTAGAAASILYATMLFAVGIATLRFDALPGGPGSWRWSRRPSSSSTSEHLRGRAHLRRDRRPARRLPDVRHVPAVVHRRRSRDRAFRAGPGDRDERSAIGLAPLGAG